MMKSVTTAKAIAPTAAMSIEQLDPIADPRWARFVDAAPGASVFAHPAWLELLARCYRYKFSALCVAGDDGELAVGMPLARVESRLTGRRLVSLPFSDFCPPVRAAGVAPEADLRLAEALADLRRSTGLRVEIHDAFPLVESAHMVSRFFLHRLELESDADAILGRASKSQKRGRAKALREGVTTRVGTDRAALDTFYGLHLRTRRRLGVPTQPRRFIRGFEQLFARGLGYVLIAEYQGQPIAAAVYLTFGDTTLYKYGASDERHLELRPNNLVMAEAIRTACESGHTSFDFGRTDTANAGLARFKRSFGAAERELSYTYLADDVRAEGHGRLDKVLAGVIQRGPHWAGQAIGSALYRHVG
jgi:CelD/BcsL family acetyltransferase involved in cellulose biosynthesis